MTRGNYGHIENGKIKAVIDPERAVKLCRLLEIDMLDLVIAMGYPIKIPNLQDPRDAAFLTAFHAEPPSVQSALRKAVGVES